MLERGFGLLFELDAGLFGTWPPAPGAPVLPWLPDAPPIVLAGGCVRMLPGAAFPIDPPDEVPLPIDPPDELAPPIALPLMELFELPVPFIGPAILPWQTYFPVPLP